jgi:predicted nuclease of predicted toxin-antitoxin system
MLPSSLAEHLWLRFGSSVHVKEAGLAGTADLVITKYADDNQLVVMTKDRDFVRFVQSSSVPEKAVWLSVGNVSNAQLIESVEARVHELERFLEGDDRLLVFLRPQ